MEREESDQLPEEGPAGQAHDDDDSATREDATENAGAEGAEGGDKQATGNPANAGQE